MEKEASHAMSFFCDRPKLRFSVSAETETLAETVAETETKGNFSKNNCPAIF